MPDSDGAQRADSEDGTETFGKWLSGNRLSAYVARAHSLGFYAWPDLGSEEKVTQASAEAIVEKTPERPGDYNPILSGWRTWKTSSDPDKKTGETKLLDLPKLPAGKETGPVHTDGLSYPTGRRQSDSWH